MIVGDIHGDFKFLRKIVDFHKPDEVIQIGDFGGFHRGQVTIRNH